MPGTSYSSGSTLEIAERRASVRALVTPPIYVNLDNLNGGLVFNISEDGLALTSALDLADVGFLTMRILLGDSEGWMEASGEIAWIGNSRKEGGIRFVGLAEEARRRINNWIAAEASRWELPEKKEAGAAFAGQGEDSHQGVENWTASETPLEEFQVEKEPNAQQGDQKKSVRQRLRNWIFHEAPRREFGLAMSARLKKEKNIVDIASVRASGSSILESANSALITETEKEKPGAIVPANSDTCLSGAALAVAKSNLQHAPVMPHKTRDARGTAETRERRARARTPINVPIYVNLEDTNGGLAFNMSEDGIALTAALAMAGVHTMSLRILIPDSKGWMEVSGQLAWRNESGKTAGITFIGIPQDSRQRIRDWLAGETPGVQLSPEEKTLPKSEQGPSEVVPSERPMAPLAEILKANSVVEKRMLDAILSGDRLASPHAPTQISISRQESPRKLQQQPIRLPDSPAEHAEITALAPASNAPRWQFSKRSEFKPKSMPAFSRIISGTRTGKLRRLAAIITLAGATAASIGWIRTHLAVRNELTTSVTQNTGGTSKPAELKTNHPWNKTTNDVVVRPENSHTQVRDFEPVPARGRASGSETRSALTHPQPREVVRAATRSTINGTLRRTEDSLLKTQPANVPERAVAAASIPAVENTRNQVAENSPAHPMEGSPAPTKTPPASVASEAASAAAIEKESRPTLPEQPVAAEAPSWSVAVSADPYPSIRVPQDIHSKKPSSTASLQIGRVISRLEPVYPEEAKHEGIVGTVKLHVVVARDGSVQSIQPISGPSALVKAAVSAVREWRYAQTLLGGQPVETEQDILVKFRVGGPSISKN